MNDLLSVDETSRVYGISDVYYHAQYFTSRYCTFWLRCLFSWQVVINGY